MDQFDFHAHAYGLKTAVKTCKCAFIFVAFGSFEGSFEKNSDAITRDCRINLRVS